MQSDRAARNAPGVLYRSARILGVAAASLFAIVAVLFSLNVSVSLAPFKDDIEALTRDTTGLDVAIGGDLYLVLGWRPALEAEGIRLQRLPRQGSPQGLRLQYLKVSFAITPVLQRKLLVTEAIARGIDVEWRGGGNERSPVEEAPKTPKEVRTASATSPNWQVEVNRLEVRNVRLAAGAGTASHVVALTEMVGGITDEAGVKLSVNGAYRNIPFVAAVDGGSLNTLFGSTGPWPFRVSAGGAGAELVVEGRFHPAESNGQLDVRLTGKADPRMASWLGRTVAAVEDYDLSFRLDAAPSQVRVSRLEGRFGATRFSGEGRWDGIRRSLTGGVKMTELDLEPVLRTAYPDERPEAVPSETASAIHGRKPALSNLLSGLEADLRIAVGNVTGVPGGIRDVSVRLEAGGGRIHLPVSLTVLGAPVGGAAILAREEGTVRLSVDVAAQAGDLGPLADAATGMETVSGSLEELTFSASASGTDLDGLWGDLQARLRVRNAEIAVPGDPDGRSRQVALRSADLSLSPGGAVSGLVIGSFIDDSFSLAISAGGAKELIENRRWPVDLRFAGSGGQLRMKGILLPLGDTGGPEMSIRLSGDRLGDLAAWTGLSPAAVMPYRLDADVRLWKSRWEIQLRELSLGDSAWTGSIGKEARAGGKPAVTASIYADRVDVNQLRTALYLPKNGHTPTRKPDRQDPGKDNVARLMEMVLFPEHLRLPELELNLDIRRLLVGKLVPERCSLRAEIQEERTIASRFRFDLGEASLHGEANLDLSRRPPELDLRFSAEQFEIGELLEALDVVEGVEARAAGFEVNASTRGRRLSDLILQREIVARIQEGTWVLKEPKAGAAVAIDLTHVVYTDKPGESLLLDASGHVRDAPLVLRWEVEKRPAGAAPEEGRPYRLEAKVADARLALDGRMVFPMKSRGGKHRFSVSGDRVDGLRQLVNVSLPPLGPYDISGVFRVLPEGYALSDAIVSIGDSRLAGRLHLVTEGVRPTLEASLRAERVQLADFGWEASGRGEKQPEAASGRPREPSRTEGGRGFNRWLDPSSGSGMDADIAIVADEVLAGADRLGSGTLRVLRGENRLSVSPLSLSIPGGDVDASLKLTAADGSIHGVMKAEIHRLDYGPLLRLKDPETTNSGVVSLVVDVESTAESVEALPAEGNGRVTFSMQPENLQAGVLDIWASNLLTALLPILNPRNESKINCIVADLTLNDGIMTEKSMVIDTSRIRVRGKTRIDFKEQEVFLRLTPRPKRPQFFSLSTPLEVRGSFSDFNAGVAPGGLVGTAIRFVTAHVVVPMQWILLNRVPEDGSDICRDPID